MDSCSGSEATDAVLAIRDCLNAAPSGSVVATAQAVIFISHAVDQDYRIIAFLSGFLPPLISNPWTAVQ